MQRKLSEEVQAIAAGFVLVDGQPRLPVDALIDALGVLTGQSPTKRAQTIAELIALAVRFARFGGAAATVAIAQLLALAGELIGDEAMALRAFRASGLEPDEILERLGVRPARSPVESGGPSSATGLFSVMLSNYGSAPK
jgi:hypothetical protein